MKKRQVATYRESRVSMLPLGIPGRTLRETVWLDPSLTVDRVVAGMRARNPEIPVLVVSEPDDIENQLGTLHIAPISGEPILMPGKAAALTESRGPIRLVLNFTTMADNASTLNDLLDDPPTYMGKPLSAEVQITCVIDPSVIRDGKIPPEVVTRFPVVFRVDPGAQGELPDIKVGRLDRESVGVIDLHGDAEAWAERLIGKPGPTDEGGIAIEPGALVTAIREKKSGLVLLNAPWESPGFRDFVYETLQRGFWVFDGASLTIPEGFAILQATGRSPEDAARWAQVSVARDAATPATLLVNAATQSAMTDGTTVREDGRLCATTPPGAELPPGTVLRVSGELSEIQWAKF